MAIKPVPPMTDTPPFPALSDRAAGTYNAKAFAFGTHMGDKFNDELTAVAESVQNNAAEAVGSAAAAGQSAFDAVNYRNTAGQFRDEAQTARNQSVAARDAAVAAASQIGTAAAFTDSNPVVKGSADATKQLRFELDDLPAGVMRVAKVPRRDGTLATLEDTSLILRFERSSNDMLTVTQQGALIDIVSGTFTQAFANPAALGNGWSCYIRNSGNGDITIPLSDGISNWKMYPGEMRLFQCDGENLRSFVIESFYRTFITTGPFIRPPGYKFIAGRLIGAGDGGQGGGSTSTGGNGGAGNGGASGRGGRTVEFSIALAGLSQGSTVTVSVAAAATGGNGATAGANSLGSIGGIGGATRFGSYVDSNSDKGLFFVSSASVLGGVINTSSSTGPELGAVGVDSLYGGASGAGGTTGAFSAINRGTSNGGVSQFGGNGGNGGSGGTYPLGAGQRGSDGQAPGGGGGGGGGGGKASGANNSARGGDGGSGARGEAQIWGVV